MWLFLAFIAVPLIEIGLFVQVGGLIGLWPTLLIVLLTAILGTWLVRSQGLLALSQIQRSVRDLRDPTEPIAHGAMILFSGALLLTPGFFTDALGFALLVPAIRKAVFSGIARRVQIRTVHQSVRHPGTPPGGTRRPNGGAVQGDVIEGEFEELPRDPDTPRGQSGWTRH